GRQKRRWWSWIALAYGFVCAVIGLDECQDARLAADGERLGGERRLAVVCRYRGSTLAARTGSLEYCAGARRAGRGGLAGGQRVDRRPGHAAGLWPAADFVLRHDSAGASDRLSTRGRDSQGGGATSLSRPKIELLLRYNRAGTGAVNSLTVPYMRSKAWIKKWINRTWRNKSVSEVRRPRRATCV